MALDKPTIGQNNWGDELNAALDHLDKEHLLESSRNPVAVSETPIELVLSDAGKFIVIPPQEFGWQQVIVPNNTDVPFDIGTVITIVTVASTFICTESDADAEEPVFVYGENRGESHNWMGSSGTHVCKLIKLDTNTWILTGTDIWQD
jgi:hypothetical protein